ncbi:MAG: histidine kinase [Arachnia sp.]
MRKFRDDVLARLTLEEKLAAVLLVASVAFQVARGNSLVALALDVALCLAAGATARWRMPATVVLTVLILTLGFAPMGWRTAADYAGLIPVVGAVAGGRVKAAAWYTAVTMIAMAVRSVRRFDLGPGLAAMVGWVVLALIAWVIGSTIQRARAMERQLLEARADQERRATARELHDEVATTFTHVIMKARQLETGEASPEAVGAYIAEEGSVALRSLREVMVMMREKGSTVTATKPASPTSTTGFEELVDTLRDEGFAVTVDAVGRLDDLPPTIVSILDPVWREVVANIIRYGDRGSGCRIQFTANDALVLSTISNTPAPSLRHNRSAFGLLGMRERVDALGGLLEAGMEESRWVVRIVLPLRRSFARERDEGPADVDVEAGVSS